MDILKMRRAHVASVVGKNINAALQGFTDDELQEELNARALSRALSVLAEAAGYAAAHRERAGLVPDEWVGEAKSWEAGYARGIKVTS